MSTPELHDHLLALEAERATAALHGLTADPGYMADLQDEVDAVRAAYTCAAVTEIATLRGQLGGPQVG